MKLRLVLAVAIGALSGYFSWDAQTNTTHFPGGDFSWAMLAAQDLLHGRDPYRYTPGPYWIPYPLPAAFVGLPFSVFTPTVGASLFLAVSVGLLAFCLTRNRDYKRLIIFLASPFLFVMVWAQWSPLIMASAFIPFLMPLVLIKPQITLPVALTNPTKRGVYACLFVLAASLVVYPSWPFVWVSQIGQYQRFFPVLTPVGPLLLLALLRWRDPDARLLLLIAVFPQRHFYDAFVACLIPKTRLELIGTVALSWGAFIWKTIHQKMATPEVALVSDLFFFLPMLVVILCRRRLNADDRPVRSIEPG